MAAKDSGGQRPAPDEPPRQGEDRVTGGLPAPSTALPVAFAACLPYDSRMPPKPKAAPPAPPDPEPFWRRVPLEKMSSAEWESLCDGCARCCLNKLEDEDTGAIAWTDVACRLLDGDTCRCRDYPNRQSEVPDCVRLTPNKVRTLSWLPPTCAYRLVAEGRDLYWWHPLVSGDPDTVHAAGVSVRGRTVSEEGMSFAEWEDRVVAWPGEGVAGKKEPK